MNEPARVLDTALEPVRRTQVNAVTTNDCATKATIRCRADEWQLAARQRHGIRVCVGNLRKFIGPAGLALILAFNYFAFSYVRGAAALWLAGIVADGRTIEEINAELPAPAPDHERIPAR
jgi:hypothetical protein